MLIILLLTWKWIIHLFTEFLLSAYFVPDTAKGTLRYAREQNR